MAYGVLIAEREENPGTAGTDQAEEEVLYQSL